MAELTCFDRDIVVILVLVAPGPCVSAAGGHAGRRWWDAGPDKSRGVEILDAAELPSSAALRALPLNALLEDVRAVVPGMVLLKRAASRICS